MHLYLHVPYCAAKCPYCDFNSIAGRDSEHADYVDALIAEIRTLPHGPYDTVFMGGGTPTMLGPHLLTRLLEGLRAHVTLADGCEFTCEANPGSADAERFAVLARHGVNRLSLGVQSTHEHHLRFLGRVHSSAEAETALALARAAVPRVSADLILGLPGQSDDEVLTDLSLFRRHDLAHASVYHLTIEPGTEFHARHARGELHEIEVERSRQLFALAWDGLTALGLEAYETSNFSRCGQESRHNLAYWRQRDYHAAGAGAVSTIARRRLTRQKHPAAYIAAMRGTGALHWREELLSASDVLSEAWMLGLRLREGVALTRLRDLGDDELRWRPRAQALIDYGLLEERNEHLAVTRAGRAVQDEVTVQLMP